MDLYCQRCGEPYEHYYVMHEMEPDEKQRFLDGENCPCCINKTIEKQPFCALLASAMRDVLGDDVDGIAAEMEDAEYMMGEAFWE